MDTLENDFEESPSQPPISPKTRKMALDTIQRLMAKYGADTYLNALPSADSMAWIEPSVGEEFPILVIGSIGNRNVLAYLLSRGDGTGEVRYCLNRIGDERSPSTLEQITCEEVLEKPLVAPFKHFVCGLKFKKRVLSMMVRYYFLLRGYLSNIDSWNDDFAKRFSTMLRKMFQGSNGEPVLNRTVEESPEPDDADNAYALRSTSRNDELNIPKDDVLEQHSPSMRTPDLWSKEANPDLHRLREYLDEHDSLYLLENIPDAEDIKFVDQTYILEAQPKKLFIGSHAKSGDDIYAYMVWLQQRGFHEIRFYVESVHDHKTIMSTEVTGKQRILHPFIKTYPKSIGPSEQADRARFTLMVKWYFIAAGIATDCILRETKSYPERLRAALDYIADQMGPAAVKPPEPVANEDATPDDGSESSYAPEENDIQPTLARELPPKLPRLPPTVAHKSAPSVARCSTLSSNPVPMSGLPRNSFSKMSTPEAIPMPKAPSRSAKRSAEDETFDSLTRLVMKQHTLTKHLNDVDHELEVMDARWEAFQQKWKRERAELEKKRDEIQEERSVVRNMFKKQRLLDAEDD
jgi:hypothetical protein